MSIRCGIVFIVTVLGVALPGGLPASDGSGQPSGAGPNWGPTWNIVHTVPASAFSTGYSTEYHYDNRMYRYSNIGGADFRGPLSLPAGALIVALELQACDFDNTYRVFAALLVCPHRGGYDCIPSDVVSTGFSETPGCDGFYMAIDPPLTVDNLVNTYSLFVSMQGGYDCRFLSVLVSYQLQISPAPMDPTFPDVNPSFWAFQEIEALAASGITQGFPDGTFRPLEPVTRAQMATFLARALGLHWPF